jgi:hypothetical protein
MANDVQITITPQKRKELMGSVERHPEAVIDALETA